MITLHNNTEYITGAVHAIFYNEDQGDYSLSTLCEEVRVEIDFKTDEIVITCYSVEKGLEPIIKKFSRHGLDVAELYKTIYFLYIEIYNELRLIEG
jgi:hypothetical protein